MEKTNRAKLLTKIYNVQQKAHQIKKAGRNDFHKYNYAREEDILAEIKPLLEAEKLAVIQLSADCELVGVMAKVNTTYIIVDVETGEELELKGVGLGEDKGDKSVYKGLTGAMKYLLTKTFLLSTGDDPETHYGKQPPAKSTTGTGNKKTFDEKTVLDLLTKWDEKKINEFTDNLINSPRYTEAQKKKFIDKANERLAQLKKGGK